MIDRNLGLIEVGNNNGISVKTTQLSRSENNNALAVSNWIKNNCTERDCYAWNKEDYKRAIASGNPLLSEKEIDEFFANGSDEKIQDIIFDSNSKVANIVILNLGTGSFLDILTRHGSLTIPNIKSSLERDVRGISDILEMIQNNNRENNCHTQVYLCGAPRIVNTFLTDLCMNRGIKKLGAEYANVTYIPSFPRQAFYKMKNGGIIPDPHYNEAEYFHFLADIEKGIVESYLIKDLMIDMDNLLFKLSVDNDVNGANYTGNDALDIIDDIAKKYNNKTGNYNCFLDFASDYLKKRYPFDFYRLSSSKNLGDEAQKLRRK